MKSRFLLVGVLLVAGAVAAAAPATTRVVQVKQPWIRWLPANLPVAGYATIINHGGTALRLVGASSADYGSVMLMQSRLSAGNSSMVPVSHLNVPAHGDVQFAPGNYHIMLSHATQPIEPGDKVPITLRFAGGRSVQAEFPVLPATATGPAG
ncbi:MAG TPA: copper chaperone PCu(A)C [Rhodanobacteraceae bacterium]